MYDSQSRYGPPAILMAVRAPAYDASSADNPTAASIAQQNEPAATPSASAIPDFLPTLIDVPMIARTFGPGLAIARRNVVYASMMPGR